MSSSRTHHRARSASAFPVSGTTSPRGHAHRSRGRSVSSVPELPRLDMQGEGSIGFPGLAPRSLARPPAPRNTTTLPPLNIPGQVVDVPGVNAPQTAWEIPLFDDRRDGHGVQPQANQDEDRPESARGFVGKLLELLGYVGRDRDTRLRRALVSLVFSMIWWFAQFVIVIALLAYSGSHESPTVPGKTEWGACDRPLGAWNALWLVKLVMSALLSVSNWKRERAGAMNRHQRTRGRNSQSDTELATQRVLNGQPHFGTTPPGSRNNTRRQPGRATGLSYEGTSGGNSRTDLQQLPPQTIAHARLSFCTSFLSLAWFLTAHVLEYTTVHNCRFAAPHLWWLTFGILCTLYLMILEIFLLGLLVFILGPVLFLIYNILLLCLGRHPLQNPHYIKPDIEKLPKSVVDQIPLVLYIPPPPGESTDTSAPITVPPAVHSYPPKTQSATANSTISTPASVPKRRFAFLKRKKSKKASGSINAGSSDGQRDPNREKDVEAAEGEDEDEDVPWDEMWEKCEYPFVRLEGNRAVCAICLMDFEEPKRVRGKKAKGVDAKADAKPAGAASSADGSGGGGGSAIQDGGASKTERTQEIQVEEVTEEERDALKLNDAGEGAQPLRLLSCGHVFHKTCLDPWLTDVSGRCPICQRPVEIPQSTKKGKRRRRT